MIFFCLFSEYCLSIMTSQRDNTVNLAQITYFILCLLQTDANKLIRTTECTIGPNVTVTKMPKIFTIRTPLSIAKSSATVTTPALMPPNLVSLKPSSSNQILLACPRMKFSGLKKLDELNSSEPTSLLSVSSLNNLNHLSGVRCVLKQVPVSLASSNTAVTAASSSSMVVCSTSNPVQIIQQQLYPALHQLTLPLKLPFTSTALSTMPITNATTISLPMSTTITQKRILTYDQSSQSPSLVTASLPSHAIKVQTVSNDVSTSTASCLPGTTTTTRVVMSSGGDNLVIDDIGASVATSSGSVKYADIDDIELPDGSKIGYPTESEIKQLEDSDMSTLAQKYSILAASTLKNYDIVQTDSCNAGNQSGSDDPNELHACRHCGKRYRWKSTLRRHENDECGGKEPAHQCPYCSYKAKQRGNLGVHLRKHHTDMPQLESRRKKKSVEMFIEENMTS